MFLAAWSSLAGMSTKGARCAHSPWEGPSWRTRASHSVFFVLTDISVRSPEKSVVYIIHKLHTCAAPAVRLTHKRSPATCNTALHSTRRKQGASSHWMHTPITRTRKRIREQWQKNHPRRTWEKDKSLYTTSPASSAALSATRANASRDQSYHWYC